MYFKKSKILSTGSGKEYRVVLDFDSLFDKNDTEDVKDLLKSYEVASLFTSPEPLNPAYNYLVSPSLVNMNPSSEPAGSYYNEANAMLETNWLADLLPSLDAHAFNYDSAVNNQHHNAFRREEENFDNSQMLNKALTVFDCSNGKMVSEAMWPNNGDSIGNKDNIPIHNVNSLADFVSNKIFTRFLHLYRALSGVFIDGSVSSEDYSKLSSFEEELLIIIIERKFGTSLRIAYLSKDMELRVKALNDIIGKKSHKRPEESYKFVLTRTIKHLKKGLQRQYPTAKDIDQVFYENYFGQIAAVNKIPLASFYYPLTKNKDPHKLNCKYFELIFQSKPFCTAMDEYLSADYLKEQQEDIMKKIKSLLQKWNHLFSEEGRLPESVEKDIKEYLSRNKRCKLPWTLYEAQESVQRFRKMADSLKSSIINNH